MSIYNCDMLTIVVDLNRLKKNIDYLRGHSRAAFCAVVKADAYGHGSKVAKLIEEKVDSFAVSNIVEADKLSRYGVLKPIFILTPSYPKTIKPNYVYTVTSFKQLLALNRVKSPYIKLISIKINTGMNRLGVGKNEFEKMLGYVYACHNMRLISVFTHFYNIESDKDVRIQFDRFEQIAKNSGAAQHCCASGFINLNDFMHEEMVRVGLAMYGYGNSGLSPVMSVYTEILQVTEVSAGEHIGYGNTRAKHKMTVATVAAGYADGYRRLCGKKRYASFNNRLCEVLSVCMDMSIIDVTGLNASEGDRVYLLGQAVDGVDLARSYNSIIYEVLTSFKGDRVKHVYE